jgi:uncharacterized protein (TIGR03067 family)
MRTGILLIAAIVVGGDVDAIRRDRAALQGVWRVTASEQGGEKVPAEDLKDLYLIFLGDAIHIREGGKSEEKFAFTLDPTKKLKEMDLTIRFGPNKGRIDRAIYDLDGNRLRICIQGDKDAPRPRDFSTRAGGKLWLVVLQKAK